MAHKLSKSHQDMCARVRKYKADNKDKESDKEKDFYLILEEPALKLILKSDITATSKILLVYLLSRVHFTQEHLYIFLPYKELEKHTSIKKATAIHSLKDLDKKDLIKLHSGTNRVNNKKIREFIFPDNPLYYNPMRNQPNIIEMTPFFAKFIKAQKWCF